MFCGRHSRHDSGVSIHVNCEACLFTVTCLSAFCSCQTNERPHTPTRPGLIQRSVLSQGTGLCESSQGRGHQGQHMCRVCMMHDDGDDDLEGDSNNGN